MKRMSAAAYVALIAGSTNAHARPKAPATAASASSTSASPEANTPPADVKLFLDVTAAQGPWTLRITNDGDVPVRIVADARLLTLDVTARSAAKAQRCALPADMRPADPLERSLVLAPKRTYVETFQPRLYCFERKAFDALASGTIVVARLGQAGPSEGAYPAAAPIDGVMPRVEERRFLEGPPIRLSDPPLTATSSSSDDAAEATGLTLTVPDAVDAESAGTIEVPLTLKNGGSRPLIVRFRPEMFSFDLIRPSGIEHCQWPVVAAAPTRELFTTLAAKHGIEQMTVDLGAYCNGHALDRAGFVSVRARLDTRSGSGESIGVRSFDGQVVATSPTFLRLHRGRRPEPLLRPHMDDP